MSDKMYHVMALTPIQQVALRGLAFNYLRVRMIYLFPLYQDTPDPVIGEMEDTVKCVDKLTTQLAAEVTKDTKTVFIYHNNVTAKFIDHIINEYNKHPATLPSEDERDATEQCLSSLIEISRESMKFSYTADEIKAEYKK